jgi:hypothetical protein
MPRLITRLPKYREHKASSQAIVTLDGRDHYLGPHGSAASKAEYNRLVGEWQANGRRSPVADGDARICALWSWPPRSGSTPRTTTTSPAGIGARWDRSSSPSTT